MLIVAADAVSSSGVLGQSLLFRSHFCFWLCHIGRFGVGVVWPAIFVPLLLWVRFAYISGCSFHLSVALLPDFEMLKTLHCFRLFVLLIVGQWCEGARDLRVQRPWWQISMIYMFQA